MIVKRMCILLLLFCFGAMAIFSQSGERVEILDAVTLESFDADTTDWVVRGSKYVDEQLLDSRLIEAWPRQLFGNSPPGTLRVLGVRGGFQRRGHNFIEVLPPEGAIDLPGFVREIELWVWNSGRDYYLTTEVQDYRGIYHTLELGNISHLGWKKLSVKVPNWVLQVESTHATVDRLRLLKFVVWTTPTERVDDFQLYFDEIRILSDLFQRRIDGEELADPEFVEQAWGRL